MPGVHPATSALLRWFEFAHLPDGPGRTTSVKFHRLAHDLVDSIPPAGGAELTTALRKLLEAKDCAVRAALS